MRSCTVLESGGVSAVSVSSLGLPGLQLTTGPGAANDQRVDEEDSQERVEGGQALTVQSHHLQRRHLQHHEGRAEEARHQQS